MTPPAPPMHRLFHVYHWDKNRHLRYHQTAVLIDARLIFPVGIIDEIPFLPYTKET